MTTHTAVSSVATNIDAEVLHIVRQVLGKADVELDDDVFDVGATSLSFVRILARIRQDHDVTVSAPDLGTATPRNIAAQVAALTTAGAAR